MTVTCIMLYHVVSRIASRHIHGYVSKSKTVLLMNIHFVVCCLLLCLYYTVMNFNTYLSLYT